MAEVNKERLMSDIRTVLADAEDLLKQAANATGERASELRETALTRLKQAKDKAVSRMPLANALPNCAKRR